MSLSTSDSCGKINHPVTCKYSIGLVLKELGWLSRNGVGCQGLWLVVMEGGWLSRNVDSCHRMWLVVKELD